MRLKTFLFAAGIVLLSAGAASAAVVTRDLNLRSGPSTRNHIIGTMPAGAHVAVLGCGGAWCRVDWHGRVGFASARYLAGDGAVYAVAPPPVYYAPGPYYYRPGPVFSFGFGWGGHRSWGGHRGGWSGHRGGYRGGPSGHRGGRHHRR